MTTMEIRHDDRTGGRTLVSTSDSQIHRDLIEFLGREFARAKERAPTKVVLVQAQAGTRGHELREWHRDESPDLFDGLSNVEGLAAQMLQIAQQEAASRGVGRHRFQVRTTQYLSGGSTHSFYLIIDPEEDPQTFEVGGTDSAAQIAQQMRHTEWAVKTALGAAQSSTVSLQQQIRFLAEQNQRLYEERSSMAAQMEAALAEQTERTTAMVLAERADDRKEQILNHLLPLAPVALSRLLRKDAPPDAGANALAHVLKALIKSINETQLAKLGSILNVEQQVLFMEAIQIVQGMGAASDPGKQGAAQAGGATAAST